MDEKLKAEQLAAVMTELEKVNWQRLVCIAIPIANMFLAAKGLPTLPTPEFCKTVE